jgi:hypothetical protein
MMAAVAADAAGDIVDQRTFHGDEDADRCTDTHHRLRLG